MNIYDWIWSVIFKDGKNNIWAAMLIVIFLSSVAYLPYLTRDIYNHFNKDKKGIVYMREQLKKSQMGEYSRGYMAGYNQCLRDFDDRIFLDGGE
jgi:hypothetical protein